MEKPFVEKISFRLPDTLVRPQVRTPALQVQAPRSHPRRHPERSDGSPGPPVPWHLSCPVHKSTQRCVGRGR